MSTVIEVSFYINNLTDCASKDLWFRLLAKLIKHFETSCEMFYEKVVISLSLTRIFDTGTRVLRNKASQLRIYILLIFSRSNDTVQFATTTNTVAPNTVQTQFTVRHRWQKFLLFQHGLHYQSFVSGITPLATLRGACHPLWLFLFNFSK